MLKIGGEKILMTRLPTPGQDDGDWGELLNNYLLQEHSADGTLKIRSDGTLNAYYQKPANGIPAGDLSSSVQSTLNRASFALNVKDFGALGNGAHDDTAAIQSAINSLPAAGGIVLVPAGTYVISASLVLSEGVRLTGSGSGSVLRVAASASGIDVIKIGDGVATVSFAGVSNIKISSDGQKSGGAAIVLNNAYRTWLESLSLEFQYRGVYIHNSTAVWLNRSDIRDTKENAITIESDLGKGFEWYIDSVLCDNPTVSNTGTGLLWDGGESLHVSHSNFQRFTNGFVVNTSNGRESRFAFIEGMICDFATDNNIRITNNGSGTAVGLTFTNCWSGTAGNYGILIDRPGGGIVQGIRWVGGKVFHNGLAGFRLAGGQDTHISDCDIIANSQTASAARHGIEVGGNVNEFSVTGCRIGGGFQQGDTQGYAIHIDPGTSDHYIITGNDCHGNNNSPKIDDNGTGVNKVVANNLTA
jgi:hypothetical protein